MKLGQIRAAIRGTKGNPLIVTKIHPDGPAITLDLQKTPLLAALEDAYPGGKGVETHLTFDKETRIISAEETSASGDEPEDAISTGLDDLGAADAAQATDELDLTVEPEPEQSTGLDDLFV